MIRHEHILLGHGSGGRLTRELVEELFLPALRNPHLATLTDAAVLGALPAGKPALTTDAFVVDPLVFPGGDLGYLSVCGTVNDLAVAGARPSWLTWALILEEGLDRELLETVVQGAARAAREAGVEIVAGDTKVVPHGKGDRVFAVTAGLGVVPESRRLGDEHIEAGDLVLVSGTLGDHGATILANRHELEIPALRSDCAPLNALVEQVLETGADVRSMHDPTRGGLATTCNETAQRSGLRIVLEQRDIPVRDDVMVACELLGVEPLYLACEGRLVLWVPERDAERVLACLRDQPGGEAAAIVGHVEAHSNGHAPLVLRTAVGGEHPLDALSGMDLPRIC